jgi:hypothetical protein
MSDFYKKFLAEEPRRLHSSGRYAALAAFGKHPGWDDFIEDLGLETESLNLARTVLYLTGIGGQIDAGAWEKLEPAQQLPAFHHLFVWQRSRQMLVGRLWSSSDGKGRKRYPMVVCAHLAGVPLGWALTRTLPLLAELEQGCLSTSSAAEVRSSLGKIRAILRDALPSAPTTAEYAPVTPETLYKIINSGSANSEGFFRVLYQIQSQFGPFAQGVFNPRANASTLRAQQLRVPGCGQSAEGALLFWSRFFLTQVDASVPLLITLPLEPHWVDVTAGEPGSQEFFCLRASPKAVPLASEVPYTLDDTFRAQANLFLEKFKRGETDTAHLRRAAGQNPAAAPAKSGWRRWLGISPAAIFALSNPLLWS